MNHRQRFPQRLPENYRQALEKLDRALEEDTPADQAAKILWRRRILFGEVDKLEQSGTVKIPKKI
jgi:hypothetical protein